MLYTMVAGSTSVTTVVTVKPHWERRQNSTMNKTSTPTSECRAQQVYKQCHINVVFLFLSVNNLYKSYFLSELRINRVNLLIAIKFFNRD